MINQHSSKSFFRIYLYFSIILTLVSFIDYDWKLDFKDAVNHLITFISYVAFWGYAFDKKILSQQFWKFFIIFFVMWEFACYTLLFKNTLEYNLFILLVLMPQYWCVLLYPFETLEENSSKRDTFLEKKHKLISRSLSIFKLFYHFANWCLFTILIIISLLIYQVGVSKELIVYQFFFLFICLPYLFRSRLGFIRAWQTQLLCIITGSLYFIIGIT